MAFAEYRSDNDRHLPHVPLQWREGNLFVDARSPNVPSHDKYFIAASWYWPEQLLSCSGDQAGIFKCPMTRKPALGDFDGRDANRDYWRVGDIFVAWALARRGINVTPTIGSYGDCYWCCKEFHAPWPEHRGPRPIQYSRMPVLRDGKWVVMGLPLTEYGPPQG